MELTPGDVAVVTGGASGIGLALARKFVDAGMRVALCDVEEGALQAAAGRLREAGGEVLPVRTDVSDPDQVESAAEAVLGAFGQIDVVCLNAGVGGAGGTLWELAPEDWRWVLGVNLHGVAYGFRSFVRPVLERPAGHVVITASLAGLVTAPFMGPYVASKHAAVALAEVLRLELSIMAPHVGVSVLCPGFVQTGIFESERNRPEHLRLERAPSPVVAAIDAHFADEVASALPPEQIADETLDAIRTGRFYVLTHPGGIPPVRERLRGIEEALEAAEGRV